jgi:hypothetical protein
MKINSLTYNMDKITLDKKKNNVAHPFRKRVNKSSYNSIYRMIKYSALFMALIGAPSTCRAGNARKRTPVLDPSSVPTRHTAKVLSCGFAPCASGNEFN